MEKKSVAFSCVVDRDARFLYQAARLLLSLRWFGGKLSDADFYLTSTARLPENALRFFERNGATIQICEPFDVSNPNIPSNKLRGLEIGELSRYAHVALIDCDTLVVQDPSNFFEVEGIGIKIADLPTVSDKQLMNLFDEFGITVPNRSFTYELVNENTFGYFNSGVVIITRDWLDVASNSWSNYCRQVIALAESLKLPIFHNEQSALACTVAALDIPLTILPSSMNLPVHLPGPSYPEWYKEIDPQIIHYHWLSNSDGYISQLPLEKAQLRASSFNARLRAELKNIAEERPGKFISTEGNSKKPHHPKIVVGTGWWCDKEPHEWAKGLGAPVTRSICFFYLWYRQVMKYLNPDRVIVTDSRSPLKPDWKQFDNIHWVELDKNYGSANQIRVGSIDYHLSGFTRSVIFGATYAYCCDADYYIYVEQDCLIKGHNFLSHATLDSDAEIFLGGRTQGGRGIEGRPAAPMIQQSLMIIRKSGLARFINQTLSAPESDGELSPEVKMERDLKPFDFLKIPFGRSRPIDFSLSHFYAQHLQDDELRGFLKSENLDEKILRPREERIFELGGG